MSSVYLGLLSKKFLTQVRRVFWDQSSAIQLLQGFLVPLTMVVGDFMAAAPPTAAGLQPVHATNNATRMAYTTTTKKHDTNDIAVAITSSHLQHWHWELLKQ